MAKTKRKTISIFFRVLFSSLIITVASNLILAVLLYKGYGGILEQIKPYLNIKNFQNIEANISTTWIIVGVSFISIFLITILFAVILSSRLVLPIRKLVKVVDQVGKGNLQVKAEVGANDETGQLANAFNEMIVKLREAKDRLEDEKTVLEVRVKARTYQLQEQAKALRKENLLKTKEIRARVKELEKSRIVLQKLLRDVEEGRRRIEEERNRTKIIIDNFTDSLLFLDNYNRISLINPAARGVFNVTDKEVVNKDIFSLKTVDRFDSLVALLKRAKGKIFRVEIKIANRVFEVTAIDVKKEEEVVGRLLILHDITKEKLIEQMKTEFVSVAAHQLRTPLSAVKWSLSLFLQGEIGKLTEEQRDIMDKTYKANERMIKLVNDLLNVARIEEGRFVYQPKVVDFVELVQSVFDSLKKLAAKKEIEFEFIKPKFKRNLIVKVDVEKITLALKNLMENAIFYTKNKGKVRVSVVKKGKEIEFSVQDNGVGIPKSQQKRIFNKFFRGANVVRMQTQGTGLGLFITKNIIEAHKGKIWFQSKEGKGTTFFFTLPLI